MYYGHAVAVSERDLELLIDLRPEQYRYERAFKLFQLQSAIIFPEDEKAKTDGWIIAAAKLLDAIEDDIFFEEESARIHDNSPGDSVVVNLGDRPNATLNRINTLLENREYRRLYDGVFARAGGLSAAVDAICPADFDAEVEKRKDKVADVAALVDFLARAVENDIPHNEINISRAIFFHLWPARNEPTSRGKRMPGRTSKKTLRGYWNTFASSASFIYALAKNGVDFYPPSTADLGFAEELKNQTTNVGELRGFLALCGSVQDKLLRLSLKTRDFVLVPESIQRIDHCFPPFTSEELSTIRAYEDNYLRLDDDDDLAVSVQ